MKRRTFIKNTAGASTALSMLGFGALSCTPAEKKPEDDQEEEIDLNQANIEIGIQLYTLATVLSDDFNGTLQMLANTGYKKIEFAGPYFFSPQEEIDNNILIQQMGLEGYGYYNKSPSELRSMLDDLGMTAPSAHISLGSMEHNLDEVLNAAKTIGHEYITIPMMLKPSLDEWKVAADKFNEIGEACNKVGIGFAYHNHSQEFATMNGQVIMDMLMERTDPNNVSFEMDVFWTTVAGINPEDYFEKYPDRFKMLHIKDMTKAMDAPNTDWQVFTDSERAMEIIGNQSVIGEGIIDFPTIIKQAKQAGIKHFFIESDFPPEPVSFAKKSFVNLNGMINS